MFKNKGVVNIPEPNPEPEPEETRNISVDPAPAGNPNETSEKPKVDEPAKVDEENNSPRERNDEKPEELAAEEKPTEKERDNEEKDNEEKKKKNATVEDTNSKFKLVGTIETVSKAIKDNSFAPKRTSNPLEFHSVRLVFPDFDTDKVEQLYTRVGSLVRTGNWDNNFSGTIDGIIEAMVFRDYQGPKAVSSEL